MGKTKLLHLLLGLSAAVLVTSCSSNTSTTASVWEETKTFGRHLQRKTQSLWTNPSDSKVVHNSDEFTGPSEEDYIPLSADDLQTHFVNASDEEEISVEFASARGGQPPASIDLFKDPSRELASIFSRVHFNTDEHVLRKKEYFATVSKIATYMKEHPNVYLFVLGHCDQRASESYNLALGTRRSNAIKNLLVKRGVAASRVYTISLGKEMPLDTHNSQQAWATNRRVEFKLYTK